MMYKLGALFFFMLAAMQSAGAQLPAGSTAPDFMVEDINGQQHHLYEVLESNKIVLLEISATWCPPCWAYHQSQALQDFYAAHGPSGDDQARVYWVEGDPNTGISCIYGQTGCNNQSAGNYAENTLYPIINSSSIATAYQISYFPTVFIICPNKRAYEVDPITAEGLWEKAQICPVANGSNNAGMFEHNPGYDFSEICDAVNLSPSFLLTNLGAEPLTSASVLLKWNGDNVQTIEWQGFLPTYGEAFIQFDSFVVNNEGALNTVVASINNNVGDEDFTNNYKNNNFTLAQHFDQTRVVLKIRTDDYAKETYWELHDEAGNMLEHGGNQLVGLQGGGAFPLGVDPGPGTYSNNTLIKDTLDLPGAGCYSIHFVDAYGDGMCCNYGNGYFKLYNINNPTTPLISSGQFEAVDRHAFGAGSATATEYIAAQNFDVQLYPNPATDHLMLDIESMEAATWQLSVRNALGQTVLVQADQHIQAGSNSLQLLINELRPGLYFLSISPDQNQGLPGTYKFVVNR